MGDWRFDGFIKFYIAGLDAATIKSAKVNLSSSRVLSDSEQVILNVCQIDTTWSEQTLVSDNRPTIGSVLDQITFSGALQWSQFDVTNCVKESAAANNAYVSFALRAASIGSTQNVYYNSTECPTPKTCAPS